MARILGLDYGTKRIGVAVSSETNTSAFPLQTISRVSDAQALEEIRALATEYDIAQIVVGLPLDQHGAEGTMAHTVKAFASQLRSVASVEYIDERFTSRMSHDQMHGAGRTEKEQRAIVDQIAAQNILQLYLDQHGSTPH